MTDRSTGHAELAHHLAEAGPATLDRLGTARLREAWLHAVEAMSDAASPEQQALRNEVARGAGLSDAGLAAALDIMLEGVGPRAVDQLLGVAAEKSRGPGLVVVHLASNVPALAVQAMLPALALGHPVLVKSATAEPYWTPAFVEALADAEPTLADAVAAACWPGGDRVIEDRVFAHAHRIVAYGGRATMDDLARRVGAKLLAYGPKLSLAVVGHDADMAETAEGLARDVALFDQRGCLSVQAVYTAGDAEHLADLLATELDRLAEDLPPGPIEPATAAAVQHLRATTAMRGQMVIEMPLSSGTVVIDPDPTLRPSPGARTVRIHPVDDVCEVVALLEPWRGQVQGVALAGPTAWALEPEMVRLGISRCAEPGRLQAVDLSWRNGGVSLVDALSE